MSRRVSQHYDTHRPRRSADEHMLVPRRCHNFVKAHLIGAYAARGGGGRVLDMCCGNGGDIAKLRHAGFAEYVGVDIAAGACERAQDRLSKAGMRGDAIVVDAFGEEMGGLVGQLRPFDLVNCQFALHYSFESEERARAALRTAASALRGGGFLVGTVANGDALDRRRDRLGKKFGDRYFRVAFSERAPKEFGDAYAFTFHGAVENLVEYSTRRETFERLARDCGLAPVLWEDMDAYTRRARADDAELWSRMGCTDILDVTHLYAVFACAAPAT